MDPPADNAPEYVYLHTLRGDPDGSTSAAIYNQNRCLALQLCFNTAEFPYFGQWKSTASGDYVMGLEPGNVCVYGRRFHEQTGTLPMLAAQQQTTYHLCFRILEGAEADAINTLSE